MHGVPPPMPSAGVGVPDLVAAAHSIRDSAAAVESLSPQHWQSPSAERYRQRMRELVLAARQAAVQVDAACAAAQHHSAELEHIRLALLGGSPVPR